MLLLLLQSQLQDVDRLGLGMEQIDAALPDSSYVIMK
jgi:hypothetical protein